jgi:hypothetical protein
MTSTTLAWGQATDRILHALAALGPSTARSIADEADLPYETVRRTLLRMSSATAANRRVRVARWTYEGSDLEKAYLRAVYALGPGRHADRPEPRSYNDVRRESAQRAHQMFLAAHPGIKQKTAVKLRALINKSYIEPRSIKEST